jgi:hypothetical protein
MSNNDNTEWTLVSNKKKKKQNKSNKKNSSNVWSLPSYLKKMRPIKKEDYTLTEKEEQMISEFNFFCHCCFSDKIEKIIKRPFMSCGICYCCAGDDPFFDDENLCIFVSEDLKQTIYL